VTWTWLSTLTSVAGSVAREYPDTDKDYLIRRYPDPWPPIDDDYHYDSADPPVFNLRWRDALKNVVSSYRKHQRGQELAITTQYTYRRSDLCRILWTVYDTDSWVIGWCPDDAHSDDGNGRVDVHADVSRAILSLDPIDQFYLEAVYVDGQDLDCSDIITRLQAILNND